MKHAEVTERRKTYRPELLQCLMLGENYQVCLRRKTPRFVDSDSMSVVCRCLASFCFRCGMHGGESGVDRSEEEFSKSRPAILERLDAAASRFNTAMQGA